MTLVLVKVDKKRPACTLRCWAFFCLDAPLLYKRCETTLGGDVHVRGAARGTVPFGLRGGPSQFWSTTQTLKGL